MAVEAYNERENDNWRRDKALAYMTAYLGRVKQFPTWSEWHDGGEVEEKPVSFAERLKSFLKSNFKSKAPENGS